MIYNSHRCLTIAALGLVTFLCGSHVNAQVSKKTKETPEGVQSVKIHYGDATECARVLSGLWPNDRFSASESTGKIYFFPASSDFRDEVETVIEQFDSDSKRSYQQSQGFPVYRDVVTGFDSDSKRSYQQSSNDELKKHAGKLKKKPEARKQAPESLVAQWQSAYEETNSLIDHSAKDIRIRKERAESLGEQANSPSELEDRRSLLKTLVGKAFDLRQKIQANEIALKRRQLEEFSSRLARREKNRLNIIAARVEELASGRESSDSDLRDLQIAPQIEDLLQIIC